MKRQFTAIMFLILVTALTCCKDSNHTQHPSGIEFDSIAIDTVATLTSDMNAPQCILKLDIKIAKGEHARQINDSLIRSGILVPDYLSLTTMSLSPKEAVDSFVKRYINEYREFYTPIFQKETNKAYGQQFFEVTTKTQGGKEGITNYIANISIISGEQNTEYTLVKNIDERSGKILSLSDILDDGSESAVGAVILKQLGKQEDKSTDDLLQEGFFASRDAYPSHNFLLNENSITFIYISGEIANRLKGEIHVDVEYSDLKKWLKI